MAENVFEAVKQSVSTREAAEFYGIKVRRNGMACCPFHDDKNPSMKVDQRFHCFGCGEDGDVIDFTAKLFDLSSKEAAEKLAQDFGLIYDSQAPPRRRYVRQKTEAQKFREDRQRCYRVLSDYYYLLKKWEADNSPRTLEEEPHPRFVEAIQKKIYVEYLLDLFLYESEEEQRAWIAEHTAEITHLERRLKIMAENKPTNRERLREITDGIEQGIKELFESEKYMSYLSVMSRFHRYSVNNTMLIYMQKPDATLVAGYNKWKNQFERHVKRGEHGITIIAPTPYKKKIEEQKLDPDTKAPMLDQDGKVIMEEREVEIPMFRPVKVFDVSQTDGKPLPELASSLSGNVQNYEAFMEALRRSAPVPLSVEPMAANMDGYFSPDRQRIAIREGMSEVQTVSAAVHEIAHSKLHDPKKYEAEPTWKIVMVSGGGVKHDYRLDFATEAEAEQAAAEDDWRYVDENQFEWRLEVEKDLTAVKQAVKNRNTEEVEAESISYAVCQYYGIQTADNSFGYIATWSQDKTLPELRASLETINKAAGELISDIDRHYKVICKERGIDLTAQPEQAEPRQPAEETPDAPTPSAEAQEALLLVDDATYLHVQSCNTGWDYTLYDAATRKQLDGGQLDAPELPLSTAALKICEMYDLGGQNIQYAPLNMIETLQEAAVQQMQTAAQATTPETTMLPDAPEQHLDEYPMPDPSLTQDDLEKCGYLDGDLLPLSKERAYELMAQDLTVYMVQQGENPAMAFDTDDLDAHDGIFAVTREEWEESSVFDAKVKERMDHQQEREQAFLGHKGDCFAIYQVKHTDELRDIRYEGLEWIKSIGRTVQRDNYDLVYTAPLVPSDLKGSVLDNLEYRFNNEHPADYRHPSMSVSDIVAIKRDGKVSCHYCDSFGFAEVPGFLPDNPLKNAEMAVEDDYGMIDGILNNGSKEPTVARLEQQARSGQSISLMDLAAAAHREDRDKKKSVVEQLKSHPKTEHKKSAPKKSAEREI